MNSTTNKRESPADLLRPRVDKEVEIITDLIVTKNITKCMRHEDYRLPCVIYLQQRLNPHP